MRGVQISFDERVVHGGSVFHAKPNWAEVNDDVLARYAGVVNPVGAIFYVGDADEFSAARVMCSGFLLRKPECNFTSTFTTAGHCDETQMCRREFSEQGAGRYRVGFGYDESSQDGRFYKVTEIKNHYACDEAAENDYMEFRLSSNAASKRFGSFLPQERFVKGQDVLVAHHPQGKAKKLSPGCVTQYYSSGNRTGLFGHSADTLPGSSGAPVISRNSGHVIGVHVRGGVRENYAVPMRNTH